MFVSHTDTFITISVKLTKIRGKTRTEEKRKKREMKKGEAIKEKEE